MRILFVAFPGSIHSVRWINQLADEGWDVHLFPSNNVELHPDFRNITTYGFSIFRPKDLDPSIRWEQLWPRRRGLSRLGMLMSRFNPGLGDRSKWLAKVIRKLKPDLVHSLEFQHAGYLTMAAKEHLAGKDFPSWAVTNWGSDIYLFGRLPEHAAKIKAILSDCDYYLCECRRDVKLAQSLGLKGEVLPTWPATGGFNIEAMLKLRQPGPTSARRVIVLKGYQNWAGRALVGLRAIEMCADVLQGYKVKIYLNTPEVKLAAELLTVNTGIPVETYGADNAIKNEDVLRLHGSARISIGLSISDAISISLLEAMIMGSFPIQSDTSCANEWLRNGESGVIVPAEDPCPIAAAIRRAVTDDELVDRAAAINQRTAFERLHTSVIRPQVVEMYKRMLASGKRERHDGEGRGAGELMAEMSSEAGLQ